MLSRHPFAPPAPATSGESEPPQAAAAGDGWVDLLDPTPEELRHVAQACHIQVPSREALQEIETSSRLRADGEVLYLSMPLGVREEAQGLAPVPLGFILSPTLLISVRYRALRAFETVSSHLREQRPAGSAAVFCALVEALVDSSADLLEQIATDLAVVSVHTFGQSPRAAADAGAGAARDARALVQASDGGVAGALARRGRRPRRGTISRVLRESLREVGSAGDQLSRMRESVLGLQRITRYVEEMAGWMPEEFKGRLASARQDLTSLVDFESHLSGKTQFLLDAVLGFINTEQNDIFKVLTIVSVVGIPPTLIASMYGMNFRHMPELNWPWGYPYGLGLIALSTLLPIVWFKRRGWW